ncbi:helix-turn-helix domain-containing protein, partial [Streptomyces sp. ISL-100]|uniref:helix-turn-helix domain-containing protein n=1 Tax=Streptomyces sp. ISL-100 TaxID=2819173 RepID=UPI001BEAA74C
PLRWGRVVMASTVHVSPRTAALAGTSRETTTKVLRDLAGHGLIRLARGRITVLDPDRLKDQAG